MLTALSLVILCVISVVCHGADTGTCPTDVDTCTAELCDMGKHVMCWRDSPDVITSGVSELEIKQIVEKHNALRRQEPATDLFKLVWDPEVAVIAEKNTKSCAIVHDKNRRIPSYPDIGQNLAAGYGSWDAAIQVWYDEIQFFKYGEKPEDWKKIGHYTQVVSSRTIRLGCGFTECSSGYGKYYACNYVKGNTFDMARPYTNGTQGSDCGPTDDGLCDCQGKLCKNGGNLDVKTCQCSCPRLYEGAECQIEKCPGKSCQNGGNLDVTSCQCNCPDLYEGDECQINKCPGKSCQNGGKVDPDTCTCQCGSIFSGAECQIKTCPTGDTHWLCNPTYYKESNCGYLRGFSDACPYICGTCQHECGAKTCQNGGTMNFKTCQCACSEMYTGDVCEAERCPGRTCQNGGTLMSDTCTCSCDGLHSGDQCEVTNCPEGDTHWMCSTSNGYYKESNCGYLRGFSEACPYICGVCQHQCGAKVCQNGGTMNYKTCSCTCAGQYTGDQCEMAQCGGKTCAGEATLNVDTCQCECEDKNPNCHRYQSDVCTAYAGWAKRNCKAHCGFCSGEYMLHMYSFIPNYSVYLIMILPSGHFLVTSISRHYNA